MKLPQAPSAYSQRDEQHVRGELERQDKKNVKSGEDVVFPILTGPVLTDEDGVRWRIVVDTSGNLSTEAL